VVSDDIGMRAVSDLFNDPTAPARLLLAGTDLMMVCSYGTDTDRCRGFADAMLSAQRQGVLPPELMAESRQRIQSLLLRAPQHAVRPLPAGTFEHHRTAGPLFTAETAEII